MLNGDFSAAAAASACWVQTLIVPDLARRQLPGAKRRAHFDFVTLAGELLNRHGIFTGGHANGNGSRAKRPLRFSVAKTKLPNCRGALARLQEQVTEISRRKGALQSEQTALASQLAASANRTCARRKSPSPRAKGEFNALQNSQRVLHQKIDTVVYEVQSLAAQEQEGLQKRDGLWPRRSSELETRERSLSKTVVTDLHAPLEDLRQQRDSATAGLTETKVALATEEQLCASLSATAAVAGPSHRASWHN